MLVVGVKGADQEILENKDILKYADPVLHSAVSKNY